MEEEIGGILALLILVTIAFAAVYYFWKMKCESCQKRLSKKYFNERRLCEGCYTKEFLEQEAEEDHKRFLKEARERYGMKE